MTDRLLVDLTGDGQVTVAAWRSGQLPDPPGPPAPLVWPLDEDALEDLRWYLEDYLRAPYGVYQERGARVADALPGWGEAIFAALFGANGPARDAYRELRHRGRPLEIVLRSASPRWLGLPWELLRDPERPTPVALDRVGVSRSLPATGLADAFPIGGQQLRVLMVISRPDGPADVGYRMVARPLLERLDEVRGTVDLVVLRPPTLDRLRKELAAARRAGAPFQIVHFDGHGVLPDRPAGPGWGPAVTLAGGRHPEGVLAFEQPGGGSHHVPAGTVAQVLAEAQVPVAVLNACQSGAVGKELEAAVATRLLQEGTACVVAMAYTVYAEAAAEFMAAFYQRLFAGDRVTDAVTAGRRRIAEQNLRPSPPGRLPLADWLVPVHYARSDEVTFPGLRTEPPSSTPSSPDQLDPLAPVDSFVGRDTLFYTLEKAARLQRVVLLHGPGGTGKTELAKAFGRWWRDTGGVDHPDGVIWHSFEPGVASFGLDGVVTEVGMRVIGTDFARVAEPADRRAAVLELLANRRLLLICDNVESIHAMPDPTGTTPPLGEDEREELRRFVAHVAAGGSSAILLTSRSDERWLGDLRRVEVPGLTREEAAEYADQVLEPFPQAQLRRRAPEFADLMDWLDGHPLSLRLVLPHLETTGPAALLAGLRGAADLPGDPDGGRTTSLAASISYSFDHLPVDARRRLATVSLFQGVADANVLGMFSAVSEVPTRFRSYATEDWRGLLDHTARIGLVSPLGAGMYRIHPALPAYLAAWWRREDPDAYPQQRAAAERAMLEAHATFADWLLQQVHGGGAQLAFAILHHQRRTLSALLGYALDRGLWNQAQAIVQPLSDYWNAGGLHEEARRWFNRARLVLEAPDGTPPALDSPAGALWLFVVFAQANRAVDGPRLGAAERAYLDIRDMLGAQPASPEQQRRLAVTYHQLGIVAQQRGRLDEAEDWYRQSLTITQELNNHHGMATSYHQLGMIARKGRRLDEAEDWYRQSLTIEQELNNHHGMATCFGQLGLLTEQRGRPVEALAWMVRCVAQFDRFPHPATGPGPKNLARLTAALGIGALERCWREVTGDPLPEAVRDYVQRSNP